MSKLNSHSVYTENPLYFQSPLHLANPFSWNLKINPGPDLPSILFFYDANKCSVLTFCPLPRLLRALQPPPHPSPLTLVRYNSSTTLLQVMPSGEQMCHPAFCSHFFLYQLGHLCQGPLICPLPHHQTPPYLLYSLIIGDMLTRDSGGLGCTKNPIMIYLQQHKQKQEHRSTHAQK